MPEAVGGTQCLEVGNALGCIRAGVHSPKLESVSTHLSWDAPSEEFTSKGRQSRHVLDRNIWQRQPETATDDVPSFSIMVCG